MGADKQSAPAQDSLGEISPLLIYDEDYIDIALIVRRLVERSGKKAAQLSREMGRSSGYLGAAIHDNRILGLSALADLAECCGYSIVLLGKDEAIVVGPDVSVSPFEHEYGYGAAMVELERNGRKVTVAFAEGPEAD